MKAGSCCKSRRSRGENAVWLESRAVGKLLMTSFRLINQPQFDLPFGSDLRSGFRIQQLLHVHRGMLPLPVCDGVHCVPDSRLRARAGLVTVRGLHFTHTQQDSASTKAQRQKQGHRVKETANGGRETHLFARPRCRCKWHWGIPPVMLPIDRPEPSRCGVPDHACAGHSYGPTHTSTQSALRSCALYLLWWAAVGKTPAPSVTPML